MADVKGSRCDERCGCPSPCPGGTSCKCSGQADPSSTEHKRCSCGEHCSCNPCTCTPHSQIKGTGKAACNCPVSCTCPTCAAA